MLCIGNYLTACSLDNHALVLLLLNLKCCMINTVIPVTRNFKHSINNKSKAFLLLQTYFANLFSKIYI